MMFKKGDLIRPTKDSARIVSIYASGSSWFVRDHQPESDRFQERVLTNNYKGYLPVCWFELASSILREEDEF